MRALLVLLALAASPAFSQSDYPSRNVRFVVPFAPGGATDIITRLIAEQLQGALGRPFTVENRGGAGGNVGAAEVASAAPDGYTILMGSPGPNVINQFLYAKMPFQADRAFTPVALIAMLPNVLVVNPALGAKSVQGLIDAARARPGAIPFGTAGSGSSGHLSVELFRSMAKLDLTHIPYKGTGPALQDLLAGHVQMMIDNVPPMLPHIRAGKLLALGVTTQSAVSSIPDVPPIAKTVPGYEAVSWVGIVGPAGLPGPIVAKLNAEANRALESAAVRERLVGLGAIPSPGTPESFGRFIASETGKWKDVIRTSGAKVD